MERRRGGAILLDQPLEVIASALLWCSRRDPLAEVRARRGARFPRRLHRRREGSAAGAPAAREVETALAGAATGSCWWSPEERSPDRLAEMLATFELEVASIPAVCSLEIVRGELKQGFQAAGGRRSRSSPRASSCAERRRPRAAAGRRPGAPSSAAFLAFSARSQDRRLRGALPSTASASSWGCAELSDVERREIGPARTFCRRQLLSARRDTRGCRSIRPR